MLYLAQPDPGAGAFLAEGRRKGAEIGNDAGWNKHVAQQVVVDGLQVNGRLTPAILLAAQTADQFLGAYQLLRTDFHLQVRRCNDILIAAYLFIAYTVSQKTGPFFIWA